MDGFEFKRHIDRAAELNPRSENMDQAFCFLLLRLKAEKDHWFLFKKKRDGFCTVSESFSLSSDPYPDPGTVFC